FPVNDLSISANARHVRWKELMAQYKGQIDVALAQKFLADHWDTYDKKESPSERTLCGHIDLSPRGSKPWQSEYGLARTVQNKAADAAMIHAMSLTAAEHLQKHPEYAWQKDILRDLNSYAWTTFQIAR